VPFFQLLKQLNTHDKTTTTTPFLATLDRPKKQ